MKIETQSQLMSEDESSIFNVWNSVYPREVCFNTNGDFSTFLSALAAQTHLIIRDEQRNLLGWLMLFDREGARFFVLLVGEGQSKKGIGTSLVREMMRLEAEVQGWVVPHSHYQRSDGAPYISPMPFYKKLGFEELDEVRAKNGLETVRIRWRS